MRENVAVRTCKHLVLYLDHRLWWTVCKKIQNQLYFLSRVRPFGEYRSLFQVFYLNVPTSAIFCAAMWWCNGINTDNAI